jgi:hypothetical protein
LVPAFDTVESERDNGKHKHLLNFNEFEEIPEIDEDIYMKR